MKTGSKGLQLGLALSAGFLIWQASEPTELPVPPAPLAQQRSELRAQQVMKRYPPAVDFKLAVNALKH